MHSGPASDPHCSVDFALWQPLALIRRTPVRVTLLPWIINRLKFGDRQQDLNPRVVDLRVPNGQNCERREAAQPGARLELVIFVHPSCKHCRLWQRAGN